MRAATTRKTARSYKSAKKAKAKRTAKTLYAKAPRAPKIGKAKERWADENGPLDWLLPTLESGNTPLAARDAAASIAGVAMAVSSFQPTASSMLAATEPTAWRDVLLEYKQRKAARLAPTVTVLAPGAAAAKPPAAFVPGARNWQPLGPTIVLNGQTVGDQPVGGRVSRLAVAPGAAVVYAASANGGVFRSNNGGTSWRSLMDRFDVNPTSFASTSLVCGAIAINANDPNRVYVGTGEGDTLQLFRRRVTSALPAYRGVGVIRSDDGGDNWVAEPSIPDLSGEAFFDLAVDPRDGDNVMGATTIGLFHRVPVPGGQFQWKQARTGVHASVVVAAAAGAPARFFAAEWGQKAAPSGVFHSDDGGATWSPTGTGFPTNDVGRIALGVQPNKPDLLYAFVATRQAAVAHGLYRLDGVGQAWKKVANLPNVLPPDDNGNSQGDYDLAIAVDPVDANIVYLGGSYADINPFPASIWRCEIAKSGTAFKVKKSASIGTRAHSDVHALVHTPGTPNELWCTCDGGVFLNRNPRGTGEFDSQNNGLACLCANFIAQHPTDPSILFTGLQDNGTARTTAGSIWSHVFGGDGGYCLINWANPQQVLVFANGRVVRSTTGGTSTSAWATETNFNWPTMTQPIVGVPFNPASPADANLVAVGAGPAVFLSPDFGASWPTALPIPVVGLQDAVFALAFASRDRLFIGTTEGHVFRADRAGNTWNVVRLDNAASGPLGLNGVITDVAVDWADANRRSIYVAFGGAGDRRRVWWFDGAKWHDRSGTAGVSGLLDVEHNALAVDRTAPNNIYVGADIGVWHSADGGQNWQPLENGLPDAPVFDLQIHPTQRLLRAATHGRGVYEYSLD